MDIILILKIILSRLIDIEAYNAQFYGAEKCLVFHAYKYDVKDIIVDEIVFQRVMN